MAVQIKVDQAAHAAGVAGQAREDLATGTAVALSAIGGPFDAYLWAIVSLPVDILTPARATSGLSAPTSSTTNLTPIDVAGTYLVRVSVDSGSGLGATPDDVAEISFYAGPALNADPTKLPRRIPAFLERLHHNVPDLIDLLGNPEGWSREQYRWFAVIAALAASSHGSGRVSVAPGGPATLVRGENIASVTRVSAGVVDVAFTAPLPDANYSVSVTAFGGTGGSGTADTLTTAGFRAYRADLAGVLADADFCFAVSLET